MHIEHGRLRAHFNCDLSGEVEISTEGGIGVMVLPGELVRKIMDYVAGQAHERNDRQVIAELREEISTLRAARDMVLATEIYDTVTKIAELSCQTKAVLGGEDCGKCGPCLAKPVEKVMRNQAVRGGWSDWQTKLERFKEVCWLEDVRKTLLVIERGYPQPVQRELAKWALKESEECGT